MPKTLRRIFMILNFKTVVVTALAVLFTYLCERFQLTAELPLTLVTIAVVFLIVFRSAAPRSRSMPRTTDLMPHCSFLPGCQDVRLRISGSPVRPAPGYGASISEESS